MWKWRDTERVRLFAHAESPWHGHKLSCGMYQSSACHKIETMSGGGFWAPHPSTVLCSDTSLVALSEGSFHSLSWRQNPIAPFLLWMLLWNRRWFHTGKCWKFLLGPLPFKWISTVDWRFRTIFWKGIVATPTCFICLWKRERLRHWNTLMSLLLSFKQLICSCWASLHLHADSLCPLTGLMWKRFVISPTVGSDFR